MINVLNPGQALIDKVSGRDSSSSKLFNQISDPMDLFGRQAGYNRDEIDRILREANQEGLDAAWADYEQSAALQQPFEQFGTNALARFGQAQEPGERYQRDWQQGSRSINNAFASRGKYNSSAALNALGGYSNQLGQEDMGRQYNDTLNAIRIGQGAVGNIGNAGQNFLNTSGSLNSSYGQGAMNNAMDYGQQRGASYRGAGNALNNLSQYFAARG